MLRTDQDELDQDLIDDISDSDYIFVIDAEGKLKSVILPDNYEAAVVPEKVGQIMEIFNFSYFYSDTVH